MVFQFLLLLPLSLAGVIILETNQTFASTKVFSIDWTNETHECVTPNAQNVTQKYVLLPFLPIYTVIAPGSINHAVHFNGAVKDIQDRGAIGVLFVSDNVYVGQYGLTFQADSDIVIPVAEVSFLGLEMSQMVKSNNSIHISVTSDPNIYIIYVHSPGKYVYQTLMVAWWLGISILAVVKLVQIIGTQEVFQLNLATSCLFLELFCGLLRVIQYIFNPMFWNETIPVPDGIIFTTLALPFETSGSILLVFFWLDVAKAKLIESDKLLKLQNIAIFLCGLIFVFEISLDIVNATIEFPGGLQFQAVFYVIVGVLVAIIYHIAAIKLWVYSSKIMRKSQMRLVTIKVQISGISVIIGAFIALVIQILQTGLTPAVIALLWGLVNIGLGIKSIAQILVFGTPQKKTWEYQSVQGFCN